MSSNSSLVHEQTDLFAPLSSDSLALFLVQVIIILVLVRVLAKVLAKVHQPPVIGEIIAGVILGPSVFGFFPNFSNDIFPPSSLPIITIISQVGLIFFMFFLGLEVDPMMLTRNWQSTIPIALTAILIPFAAGAGLSYWLYTVEYTAASQSVFLMFVGTILAFTAFPVLARILTSFRLIDTPIGLHALSIAAIDDVLAWVTLAITLSYAGGGSAAQGVYTMLIIIGFILTLVFFVRPALLKIRTWLLKRKTKLGPSELDRDYVAMLFLLLCAASTFTQLLGVHAFLGAFAFGLIVPKDEMIIVALAPKIELLIVEFFLPLYFANSGLSTQLQSLNTGEAWGMAIVIICVCTVSKVIPVTIVTYYTSIYFGVNGEEDDETAIKAWEEERELSKKAVEVEKARQAKIEELQNSGKPDEIELQPVPAAKFDKFAAEKYTASIASTSQAEHSYSNKSLAVNTTSSSSEVSTETPMQSNGTAKPDESSNVASEHIITANGSSSTPPPSPGGASSRSPASGAFGFRGVSSLPSFFSLFSPTTAAIMSSSAVPPVRRTHLPLRTCIVIGVLMNTSGLVALIALNIGLERGILGPKVFTMLVLMALVTTFITSPIFYRFFVVDYMKEMKVKRAWARKRRYQQEKRRNSMSGNQSTLTEEQEAEVEKERERLDEIEEKREADAFEEEKTRMSILIPTSTKRLSISGANAAAAGTDGSGPSSSPNLTAAITPARKSSYL